MQRIDFVKQFSKSKSLPLSSENLINMYAKIEQGKTRSVIALFGCAGLRELVDVDIFAPVYAIETMGVYLYAVVGSTLFQVDTNWVATSKGAIPLTPNKIRLSVNENGNELVILTSSGRSWIFDEDADTLTEITDGDYDLSSDVTSIDGYTLFSKQDSDQYFYSANRDATSYDALDFQTAEGEPDILIANREFQAGLWAFGTKTLEFYQNVGGNPIFQRAGTRKKIGCYSRDSVAQIRDTIFWLADDKGIYLGSGYQYLKISTDALDETLEAYSELDLQSSEAFCYSYEGHDFYNITFPTKDRTFTYDLDTKLWHERQSLNQSENRTTRWRANCFAEFGGRRIVGDFETGKLYYLDGTYHKEGEDPLIATIITSPLFNDLIRTSVSALYIDMETGVGITSGQGSVPKLMFQSSDNGGRTYSSETFHPIGEMGKYRTRVKITPIGSSDNFTFRIKISDPIRRRIFGGYIEFEAGSP